MNALILVDIQNDFMPGGALAVPGGDAIVGVVNRLQQHFPLVVATQDWHPPGHASFASSHPGRAPFESITVDGLEQTLWPDHCVQGTTGANFHPDLDTRAVEAVFRKGMDPAIDSYSGFYDNGHRRTTGLAGYLREKGAETLYFCGLAADICVAFSIRDAIRERFATTLVEDATRALDDGEFAAIRAELTAAGTRMLRSDATG
jgi:nicotinamidase/pyrazinamidase